MVLSSSRRQFRKLRALTDKTPATRIRRMRLVRAPKLLEKGADTIKEVVYAVGFRNHSSFTTPLQGNRAFVLGKVRRL